MKKITLPTSKLARCALINFYIELRKRKFSRKEAREYIMERFNLATGQPRPELFFYG